MFDGLDMHLYTLVAAPFVAQLLEISDTRDARVGWYSSVIQAAFLLGWALGGGFFGRLGDRLGRSKALSLTILTYAVFTGLSSIAQTWWHLLIFRFLAALGIGGEWAVGASLISETWPGRWRPWIAATLQSGVNLGILLASITTFLMAGWNPRAVFLVGILPALLVFWIRREVPEPEEWRQARSEAGAANPRIRDLFLPGIRPLTGLLILVCATSLTAHWAFMFWFQQHLRNLPDLISWSARGEEPLCQRCHVRGDDRLDRGQFRRGLAGPAHRLPAGDRTPDPGLLRHDGRHLRRATRPYGSDDTAARDQRVLGTVCTLHHVSPAAFPHPSPDHGRRILLQHRPDRRGCRVPSASASSPPSATIGSRFWPRAVSSFRPDCSLSGSLSLLTRRTGCGSPRKGSRSWRISRLLPCPSTLKPSPEIRPSGQSPASTSLFRNTGHWTLVTDHWWIGACAFFIGRRLLIIHCISHASLMIL